MTDTARAPHPSDGHVYVAPEETQPLGGIAWCARCNHHEDHHALGMAKARLQRVKAERALAVVKVTEAQKALALAEQREAEAQVALDVLTTGGAQ